VNVAPSPDLVDMSALRSIFNPENEAYRLPTRGSARRTAILRIPYKLGASTGPDGSFRMMVCPMAFGSASSSGSHISIYSINDSANISLSSCSRYQGPITTGIESFRVNSMSIKFDRT